MSAPLHGAGLIDFLKIGVDSDITAVAAQKSHFYSRLVRADGTYEPETYAFGPGGTWRGERVDDTIDKLTFLDVAHVIAIPLAHQNYVPATDPATARLLIMVYWGTTHGTEFVHESAAYANLQTAQQLVTNIRQQTGGTSAPRRDAGSSLSSHPGNPYAAAADEAMTTAMAAVEAQEKMRYKEDFLNVQLLGYGSWWESTERFDQTAFSFRRQDLLDELEEDRYFVVLMAYDFQLLKKEKKHRLLWETRFSVRERHHAFDEDLPLMAAYASQYFGQDSHGLIHKQVPMGHVHVGEVKSLGEVTGTAVFNSGSSPMAAPTPVPPRP